MTSQSCCASAETTHHRHFMNRGGHFPFNSQTDKLQLGNPQLGSFYSDLFSLAFQITMPTALETEREPINWLFTRSNDLRDNIRRMETFNFRCTHLALVLLLFKNATLKNKKSKHLKKKERNFVTTYSEGFFFETRVFGYEPHAKTGAMQIGWTFGRVHTTRTDVADVIARSRNGNSAAGHTTANYSGGSYHRRWSGSQRRRRHRIVTDHDGIASWRVAVNATKILCRDYTTVKWKKKRKKKGPPSSIE